MVLGVVLVSATRVRISALITNPIECSSTLTQRPDTGNECPRPICLLSRTETCDIQCEPRPREEPHQ